MAFSPIPCTVVRNTKLSPSFRRITLGAPGFGPAGPIYDLRVKLLISDEPLPNVPDWHSHLSVAQREALRTYSIRDRRVKDNGDVEIDIDFVDHPGGLASEWAAACEPGDTVVVIGPPLDDASGMGIEFNPGDATTAYLLGDETAAPAIARTVEEWPDGVTGHAFIEVPSAEDILDIETPDACEVTWLPREGRARGAAMQDKLSELLGFTVAETEAASREDASGDDQEMLVWETPAYSSSGEDLQAPQESRPDECYYWIAGESSVVKAMRRDAVRNAGVPRSMVSFMGYWKDTH
ncbi:siderophore-interacting protein [Corynebacterium sp. 320]|uniref:siderophore-interacting protein n=1 Tax=Corynebacterium TaxID=1716 RepID=UPI00125CC62F|nr:MULTISPECIES: siderophore-interacting protein [Corynebacterium]KAB1503922.1 siderophore-interacting protein [Corynebacterium sp. 320]KAB1552979.1 siderophore-interacting protein [Corynebacterium sp. 321]KAB1553801.1 siderophore-interacting protein [Corynebacterium sp. 319]KAB3528058.1 siderophore-interacting protein [Corynebacterium sp. 250]KAB3540454.1 siderophore-interacting protein [Corynebacterium sp. 366]